MFPECLVSTCVYPFTKGLYALSKGLKGSDLEAVFISFGEYVFHIKYAVGTQDGGREQSTINFCAWILLAWKPLPFTPSIVLKTSALKFVHSFQIAS